PAAAVTLCAGVWLVGSPPISESLSLQGFVSTKISKCDSVQVRRSGAPYETRKLYVCTLQNLAALSSFLAVVSLRTFSLQCPADFFGLTESSP
ncbi:hypothetical protein, partial [Pseudomonas sp. GM49]|uniref:hypothetical protein n=1 Tax=Pseudomonas sp. GM49 TaxID=1144331 RepID=UPI001EE6405F